VLDPIGELFPVMGLYSLQCLGKALAQHISFKTTLSAYHFMRMIWPDVPPRSYASALSNSKNTKPVLSIPLLCRAQLQAIRGVEWAFSPSLDSNVRRCQCPSINKWVYFMMWQIGWKPVRSMVQLSYNKIALLPWITGRVILIHTYKFAENGRNP